MHVCTSASEHVCACLSVKSRMISFSLELNFQVFVSKEQDPASLKEPPA